MDKKLFAIFGNPVAHSRSPLMHNYTFRALGFKGCYTRMRLNDGDMLRRVFFDWKLSGANVTVPHKEAAFKACDEIRGFAREVGVVNTIVEENGHLVGYNTDADGFLFAVGDLLPLETALILGAGGTARALAKRLRTEGVRVYVLNRSAARLQPFIDDGFDTATWETFTPKAFDLIVNTTSAGLQNDALPAPEKLLQPLLEAARYAADAIYGKTTPFLARCKALGLPAIDGAEMLLGQGVLAHILFTGGQFKDSVIERAMRESFDL